MLRTRIRNIIGFIIIIFIALFALLIFKLVDAGYFEGLRANFDSDWQDLLAQLRITKENTRELFFPSRKPPTSFLVVEESLKQALPQVFLTFSLEQWNTFWDLIYGVYETDDLGINYRPKRKRQLNIDEIQDILSQEFSEIFPRFNEQMWKDFWVIVFKK
jgi:hypothetical protein